MGHQQGDVLRRGHEREGASVCRKRESVCGGCTSKVTFLGAAMQTMHSLASFKLSLSGTCPLSPHPTASALSATTHTALTESLSLSLSLSLSR